MVVAQSNQNSGTDMMQIIKEAREKKAKQEATGNPLNNARSGNTGKGVVIGEDDFFKAEDEEEKSAERRAEPTTETDSSVNTKPPKVDNIFDF